MLKVAGVGEELYQKLSPLDPSTYTEEYCQHLASLIERIRVLKAARNAVVLAHNYQRPEIFEVADFIGDSLGLSQEAAKTEADIIVFCGVHFMAETAKIVNPTKTVLLPDLRAGCSLADTVTAEALEEKLEELRAIYPDLAVVCYVNTTADVKALADVCCTSSNALKIINALPNQHILFVPDENLARYVQAHTDKYIIPWRGTCYVHHQITPESISMAKRAVPQAKVLVHPECREDVIALADAVLSTEGMVRYAKKSEAKEFIVVTECGLSDRLFLEVPGKKFYKSCKLCQFMKVTTLDEVLDSLEKMQYEIVIPEEVRKKAERALTRMFELTN